jgi:hypothetical protein
MRYVMKPNGSSQFSQNSTIEHNNVTFEFSSQPTLFL